MFSTAKCTLREDSSLDRAEMFAPRAMLQYWGRDDLNLATSVVALHEHILCSTLGPVPGVELWICRDGLKRLKFFFFLAGCI
jgi:hypothetical protein